MADPSSRRSSAAARLRAKLRQSRESLADQFEFKMFVIIKFKSPDKKEAIFEVEQVLPVMTNDYESVLQKGVNNNEFSAESSIDLISQDIVQLHARKWSNRRSDIISCSGDVDLLLWPRKDIASIECKVFSRWKHDKAAPFMLLKKYFTINESDYSSQLEFYHQTKQKSRIVLTNPEQSSFLFLSHHQLNPSRGLSTIYRLNSLCVYVPQNELTNWSPACLNKVMSPYLDGI